MKPSSIYLTAEDTLRFNNLAEYYGLHNRSECFRRMLKVAEQRAKIASCFFTDNLEWIKDDLKYKDVLERIADMRDDFYGEED